jgi:FlaA1/EpsC-like NDP-sugar epimerase
MRSDGFGSPWLRRLGVVALDMLVIAGSLSLAFWLRFDVGMPPHIIVILLWSLPLAAGLKGIVFLAYHLDRLSWKHIGIRELALIAAACLTGSVVFAIGVLILRETGQFDTFPRSVLGIDFALSVLAISGLRLSRRLADHIAGRSQRQEHPPSKKAVIVGAGNAGAQLARAIQEEPTPPYLIVGFVDDNPRKHGAMVRGIPVLGPRSRLPQIAQKLEADSLLIAIPSARAATVRETVELAKGIGLQDIKIVPNLSELYTGRVTAAELRKLEPADVLQRDEIEIDPEPIRGFVAGRTALVTGAAGSIGSELCRQLLRFGVRRLTAVDFNETGLFDLDFELHKLFPAAEVELVVADVRDRGLISARIREAAPDVVYHAAAYKHVPMMEAFPAEAVKANVEGTRNVFSAACDAACEAFVLISTDKAVRPTSVMGASKRVAEMLVGAPCEAPTRSLAVRFGNVLGSRGSVLHTFRSQIEARQAVTVTHPEMERYFMVTSEAVQLVLLAGAVGRKGQVLVLDMGHPVKIVDLARDMIRFYGLEPDVDIPVVFSGVRPGEKLFEELLASEDATDRTEFDGLLVARLCAPEADLMERIEELIAAAHDGDQKQVLAQLAELVPQYTPSAEAAHAASSRPA